MTLAPEDASLKKNKVADMYFQICSLLVCAALWSIMTFAAAGANKKSYGIMRILLIQLSDLTFTDVKESRDVARHNPSPALNCRVI